MAPARSPIRWRAPVRAAGDTARSRRRSRARTRSGTTSVDSVSSTGRPTMRSSNGNTPHMNNSPRVALRRWRATPDWRISKPASQRREVHRAQPHVVAGARQHAAEPAPQRLLAQQRDRLAERAGLQAQLARAPRACTWRSSSKASSGSRISVSSSARALRPCSMCSISSSTTATSGRAARCGTTGSCSGQPITAMAPRSKLRAAAAPSCATPLWMCGIERAALCAGARRGQAAVVGVSRSAPI